MLSSLLAGLGGPVGEVFPWDWICWRRTKEEPLFMKMKEAADVSLWSFALYGNRNNDF